MRAGGEHEPGERSTRLSPLGPSAALADPESLEALLERYAPDATLRDTWGGPDGCVSTAYLGRDLPQHAHVHVAGARGVVVRRGRDGAPAEVLVLRTPAGALVLPGGGREPGETPEETFRREVLEEAGWGVAEVQPLGFVHIRRLERWRPGLRADDGRPYPYDAAGREFLWAIFVAAAGAHRPEALFVNPMEPFLEIGFLPLDEVRGLPLLSGRRLHQGTFLAAALRIGQDGQDVPVAPARGRGAATQEASR